ncbi:MAG TPA: XdhC family protein [Thermoanaerobaculia bacterium]|nr:XdhC family protein [Thermoanaerobaculia bacterium]
MGRDVLILAAELARREEPFVLATVVRRQPASSARQGDMAVITAAGEFHGWLGGSCTRPTVVREALRALANGRPGLIALSPDPAADSRPGIAVFPMTCHSGGTVDIYVEPVLPRPRFVVFGLAPVAQALARLGKAMGYGVEAADPGADRAAFPDADRFWTGRQPPDRRPGARVFAVVATMGERDEEAILEALAIEPEYLGVVASAKRVSQIRETLLARGASEESLARIQSPAGLDIGARTPEEIAVSILAEIVQTLREDTRASEPQEPLASAEERDPVCGMTVEVSTAAHRAEVGGRAYFFCCGGCRERFLAAPERYSAGAAPGGAA